MEKRVSENLRFSKVMLGTVEFVVLFPRAYMPCDVSTGMRIYMTNALRQAIIIHHAAVIDHHPSSIIQQI